MGFFRPIKLLKINSDHYARTKSLSPNIAKKKRLKRIIIIKA